MTKERESVFELRTKYGEERASMLNRLFTLPSEIPATDIQPESLDPNTLVTAAGLSEEQLQDAVDVAYAIGDSGIDTVKTLLQVAMQRDMDLAVAHIISLEEEWEAAYNNIVEADNVTAAEPEEIAERFETYTQPEITQQSILAGDHPELNKLGMIR